MNKINLSLLIILFLGLVIRLYRINISLLEFYPSRQIQTADIARNFLRSNLNIFNPTVSYFGPGYTPFLIEFPGYNYAVAILYSIFGIHEVIGRYFSLVGWIISLILIYKIALRISSRTAANIAALFYCLSPLSILISRSFQPDQWMLTFSLAGIYSALLSQGRKWFYFYLSAIFASLSILIKLPSLIFTLIPISYLILKSKKDLFKLHYYFYLIIALLPTAMWFLYAYFRNQAGLPTSGNFSLSNWFGFEVFLNPKYYLNIFGFEYNLVLLPIGIILFVISICRKLTHRQRFLYFWLASIVLYFLIFNKHNMTHEYYHLPFLSVASIFIGIGTSNIVDRLNNLIISRKKFLFFLVTALFVLMIPTTLARAYKPIDHFKGLEKTAKAIKRITRSNDLIIGSIDAGPALVYYADRSGWTFEVNRQATINNFSFFGVTGPVNTDTVGEIESLRQKGAVVFASADKSQFLENQNLALYMRKNYSILEETENYIIFDLKFKKLPKDS